MSSGAVCCGEQFWKSFFIRDVLNVFSKWSGGPVDSRSRLHRVYLRLMATPKQVLSPRGGGGEGDSQPHTLTDSAEQLQQTLWKFLLWLMI